MNKKLTFILIFSSFLSFGQEYAWWFTSKNFLRKHVGGAGDYEYLYRVIGRDNEGNVLTSFSWNAQEPSGYYKVKKLLPVKVGVTLTIRDPKGNCFFSKGTEVDKFEYLLAGNISTIGLTTPPPDNLECIDKFTKDVNELLRFHFYSIVLPYYAQPTDNNRALEEKLFKTAENTFTEEVIQVQAIRWKYDYNNQGYKDFPDDIKHNFPMNATVGEILVNETIERNKPLKIKAVLDTAIYGVGGKILPVVESDILSFNLIPSSPQLTDSDFTIISKNRCNYSSDGGFILNFKRDLNTAVNEKLVITLYDKNDVLINQEATKVLTDNGDGTYSYQWVNPLDADTYKIKYQTLYTDDSIAPEDNSWASLVATEFTIPETMPLSFSITAKSDENCFEVNDGYIDVSASGEDGRTFLYQLKKEGKEQIYNGTIWVDYSGSDANADTWFAFLSAKSTRINKLGKGKYQVKVKDSQGCFLRVN